MAFAPTAKSVKVQPLVKTEIFTVATLPTPGPSYAGCVATVTNGDAGSPCLAICDGIGWFKVAVGAAVSAT